MAKRTPVSAYRYFPFMKNIFCQTPDLDQDLSLGVDFVFPLEQQEEEEPPTKIYRKDVKHMSKIWHISLTHKNKIK